MECLNFQIKRESLSGLYTEEGLSDDFLDRLVEGYQKTKLKIERQTIRAREDLAELNDRREWLISLFDRVAEGSTEIAVDEVERQLELIDSEIDRRTREAYDQIDMVTRDVRSKISSMEAEIERDLYEKILKSIA